MTRETEKMFKEFHKFVEGKDLKNEEELNAEMAKFMKQYNDNLKSEKKPTKLSADDYLDMAYEAETDEECIKNAKKALKLDSNCLDAKLLIIEAEEDLEVAKKQLENAIKGETKHLEKEGYFEEDNIGYFYGILETRPYIRARNSYTELLMVMGKYKKAIAECEDIIRLNENDNLGVRYKLMTLYAAVEDIDGAKALYKKFKEDSMCMLYPLAILYYKLDDYDNAKFMLKKITKSNNDFKDFLTGELEPEEDKVASMMDQGMYRPGTIEEVLVAFRENAILINIVEVFNDWAAKEGLKATPK